jgi:hypothetical protein
MSKPEHSVELKVLKHGKKLVDIGKKDVKSRESVNLVKNESLSMSLRTPKVCSR